MRALKTALIMMHHAFTYHVLMLQVYVQSRVIPVHGRVHQLLYRFQLHPESGPFRIDPIAYFCDGYNRKQDYIDDTDTPLPKRAKTSANSKRSASEKSTKCLCVNTNLPGGQSGPVLHQPPAKGKPYNTHFIAIFAKKYFLWPK